MCFDQDESVAAYAKLPVTETGNQPGLGAELLVTVINHDKIVSGSVIFEKVDLHLCNLIWPANLRFMRIAIRLTNHRSDPSPDNEKLTGSILNLK